MVLQSGFMVVTQTRTLGQFIDDEMAKRHLSAREFADLVGVSHTVINRLRNHGVSEEYSGKPVGDPSLEFLKKLADATGVHLFDLVDLAVGGLKAEVSAEDRILAQRIAKLPPEVKEVVDDLLMGHALKTRKDSD